MNHETRFDAVHVDANPVTAVDEAPAVQIKLLDEDEIVELSIKPSPWFIAIVSARFVTAAVIIAAALAAISRDGGSQVADYAVVAALLAAVLRVVVASLQWASRLYVLTNRRVMRFSGTLNVEVAECHLARISRTNLEFDSLQRMLRLGTVCMTPAGDEQKPINWEHVAHVAEVYEQVVRAIRKAQSK